MSALWLLVSYSFQEMYFDMKKNSVSLSVSLPSNQKQEQSLAALMPVISAIL